MRKPFKDNEFKRDTNQKDKIIPLTKYDYRLLTLAEIDLNPTDFVLDIGAGTGGLTTEAARQVYKGKVIAIEKDHKATELIKENIKNFKLKNIEVINQSATEAFKKIKDKKFDKIIIGGSGEELKEILEFSAEHLKSNGCLIANFITLENTLKAKKILTNLFKDIRLIQVIIAEGRDIGSKTMMLNNNPIFMIIAQEKEC